jgi:hypothetical protein
MILKSLTFLDMKALLSKLLSRKIVLLGGYQENPIFMVISQRLAPLNKFKETQPVKFGQLNEKF